MAEEIWLGLLTIFSLITGGIMHSLRQDIKEVDKVMLDLQTSLPEKYVLKQDFKDSLKSIDTKLDRVLDKLDMKQDKAKK